MSVLGVAHLNIAPFICITSCQHSSVPCHFYYDAVRINHAMDLDICKTCDCDTTLNCLEVLNDIVLSFDPPWSAR